MPACYLAEGTLWSLGSRRDSCPLTAAPGPRREALFEGPFLYLSSRLSFSALGVVWASVPHPVGSTHLFLLMGLRGRCPSLKDLGA